MCFADVGAGTGILSLFCMKAGAKKVYAVEASPMAIHLREIVAKNNAQDVIEVIHKRVEDVELQEKVDILISEWMGFYLVHESMLDSVLEARDKHLKEDGILMPSKATLMAAPCHLEGLKKATVEFWDNVYGFDMSPLSKEAIKRTKPEIEVLSPAQLLADPVQLADFHLKYVTHEELSSIESRKFVSITKAGRLQGLALWFSCSFESYEDKWQAVELSTAPDCPPTHWKQTVIPLFESDHEALEEDEIIGWELRLKKAENSRQYAIQVEALDPSTSEHPVPCHCQSAKCALIAALLEKEEQDMEDTA